MFRLSLYCALCPFLGVALVAVQAETACNSFSLMNTSHLLGMGPFPRLSRSVRNQVKYCDFHESCCTDAMLESMRGEFIVTDYFYSAAEYIQEKLRNNEHDYGIFVTSLVGKYVPYFYSHLQEKKSALADIQEGVREVVVKAKPLQNAMFTLWSSYLTYATGLMCSVCVPDTSPFLRIDRKDTVLLLQAASCDEILESFVEFLDELGKLLNDKSVRIGFKKLLFVVCSSHMTKCDKSLLEKHIDMIFDTAGGRNMTKMVCGEDTDCRMFLCQDTLGGLGLYLDHLSHNLLNYFTKHWKDEIFYNETARYIKKINSSAFLTKGIEVHNMYFKNEGYNTVQTGCGSHLSDFACKKADVDRDTHTNPPKAHSVAGTILLVLLVIAVVSSIGFYVYKKRTEDGGSLNLYSSLN